jgi:malate dehydrogenase
MAVASDGSYGIPEGVVFSYPVRCTRGEYRIVQGLSIDEFARGKLKATDTELREERAGVTDLI